ncbi:hypothetical protein MKW94_009764 [Papaver nudicaule]|uniref:RRM domain-containing protein n=1 Tax=Papaver nudicaule TaxID=74823 RepID=A0AA41RPJ5_PAPNU|nr:hypothetical protein [Papaver nudicaule]
MGDKSSDAGSNKSIFVCDLSSDITDTVLQETFASRYTSVQGAQVVTNENTGRSKGYGFVRFGDDSEMTRAMTDMNGVYCSSRAMRISPATPRKSAAYQHQQSSQGLHFLPYCIRGDFYSEVFTSVHLLDGREFL